MLLGTHNTLNRKKLCTDNTGVDNHSAQQRGLGGVMSPLQNVPQIVMSPHGVPPTVTSSQGVPPIVMSSQQGVPPIVMSSLQGVPPIVTFSLQGITNRHDSSMQFTINVQSLHNVLPSQPYAMQCAGDHRTFRASSGLIS